MAMGKVKIILMVCSGISAVVGLILVIVAIANMAMIPSDFAHVHASKKEKDVCSPSKNETDENCKGAFVSSADKEAYPRYYIPDTCPGVLGYLAAHCGTPTGSITSWSYGKDYYDKLCSCKSGRLGSCAFLALVGLVQIGGGAFLLFTILKKPQMPIKKKWFLFLIVHIVVLLLVLVAAFLGWWYNIGDDEAVYYAKYILASLTPGFNKRKSRSRSARGLPDVTVFANLDSNPAGGAFTGLCGFDLGFCIVCIVLFFLFKCVKVLQKMNEAEDNPSGGVAPEQPPEAKSKSQVNPNATVQPSETKTTGGGKPDESNNKPESKDSKGVSPSTSKTVNPKGTSSKTASSANVAGGTRKSQKDVAGGGGNAKERPSKRDLAASGTEEKKK